MDLKFCSGFNNAPKIFHNFFEEPRLEAKQTASFNADKDTIDLSHSLNSCSSFN